MAEYIERKKLIDLCNEIINCDWNKKTLPVSWADAYECFMEDIDSQPAADVAEVKWISVEDRLPEEGETVLATVYGKPVSNITLIGAYEFAVYYGSDGWFVEEYPEWDGGTVTHWMPLPEPPKIDGGEHDDH